VHKRQHLVHGAAWVLRCCLACWRRHCLLLLLLLLLLCV
jgi:hypothetical protein